ncbi:Ig-like domain-containing protein [Marinoscillum sp. MHG1-6]|uniref:Ig-like domain-containing protein n=1 Tax=Marinoscillum sp. MHG1-6 TaxID=2959627 RepID=UPI0021577ED2|nr:Ig-like domain-containing protein [Marinoscillum sp. MHG1-6]
MNKILLNNKSNPMFRMLVMCLVGLISQGALIFNLQAQSRPTTTQLLEYAPKLAGSPSIAIHDGYAYMLYTDGNDFMGKITRYNLSDGTSANSGPLFETIGENDAGHNDAALAVDGNGYLHAVIGVHNDKIRYYKSTGPGTYDSFEELSSSMPGYNDTGVDIKEYTYPVAETASNGDVVFVMRRNGYYVDGGGSQHFEKQDLYHYDLSTGQWSMLWVKGKNSDISNERYKNAYMSRIHADGDNNIHIVTAWSWYHNGSNTFQRGTYLKYDVDTGKCYKADGTDVTANLPIYVDDTDGSVDFFFNSGLEWGKLTMEIQTPHVTLNQFGHPVVSFARNWEPGLTKEADDRDPDLPEPIMERTISAWDGTQWVLKDHLSGEKPGGRPLIAYTGEQLNTYSRDNNGTRYILSSIDGGFSWPGNYEEGGTSWMPAVAKLSENIDLLLAGFRLFKVEYPEKSPPPTLVIDTPVDGERFLAPDQVATIQATATSEAGVDYVDFYINGVLAHTDASSPYEYDWQPSGYGSFEIKAIATDINQKASDPFALDIIVDSRINLAAGENGGSVSGLSGEQNDANGYYPATNLIDNSAVETDRWSVTGFPNWVEIDLGSNKFISRTELIAYEDRAYQFIIEAKVDQGEYVQIVDRSANVTAGAVDAPIADEFSPTEARFVKLTVQGVNQNISTWTSILEFRVFGKESVDSNPTLSWNSPIHNQLFFEGDDVTLSVNSYDDGSVTQVEFFNGSESLTVDTSAPYEYKWTNLQSGYHVVKAVSTDNDGNKTSNQLNIRVEIIPNAAPEVSISSPSEGAVYTTGETITVLATATDSDGSVSRVEFYLGTELIATDNTAPYSMDIENASAGYYNLKAIAIDDDGASGVSVPVLITVVDPLQVSSEYIYSYCVYPNPVSNVLNIEWRGQRDQHVLSRIDVVGMDGRIVKAITPQNEMDVIRIDVSNMPVGLYILNIVGSDNNILGHYKFLKNY